MRRFNKRDAVAGVVIVFLLGVLAGQWLDQRRGALPGGRAAAAEPVPVAATPAGVATVADARGVSDAFARVAAKVLPAVVNINSTRVIRGRVYTDPLREWLYGDGQFKEPDQVSTSLGSGVIVEPSGVVVTNNHNIAGASEIVVTLADGRDVQAKVLGSDSLSDVAVLKIDAANLPYAPWGDSDKLRVGEWVIAVGNPFGFNQTVTAGIVSAKGRNDIGVSDFEDFIQTDAAINPGNSGGALVDINGNLIGINTAIFSKTGGYQGIGFAIPSNIARANATQLMAHGRIIRGWIGILAQPLKEIHARRLGLTSTNGALVVNLYRDQPAVRAGLLQYDVITAVDGRAVKTAGDLRRAIAEAPLGSSVKLTLWRRGQQVQLTVKIEEHPTQDGEPVPGI